MSDTKIEIGNVVWLPGSPEQKMTVLAIEEHRVHCAWINTAREVEYFDGPIAALAREEAKTVATGDEDLPQRFEEMVKRYSVLNEEYKVATACTEQLTEQCTALINELSRRDREATEVVKIARAAGGPNHGVSEVGKLALWFAQRYEVLKREGNEQIVALQSQLAEARAKINELQYGFSA